MSKTNRDKRRAKQRERLRRQNVSGHRGGAGDWSVFGPLTPPSAEESVALVISTAIHAAGTGHPEGVEECAEVLADPTGSRPGWRRIAERSMATTLAGIIASMWRGGWQPADIARLATRELGPRHARLALDAVAGELRSYAAATIDETFHAQLAALDARVWWDRDEEHLAAFATRERIERPAAVLAMLQVICLLAETPTFPVLCPPPGQARRGTLDPARRADRAADERILAKVRALLAKAESTEFSEEAEAFTAGAQKLMARHSIDYALLAHRSGAQDGPVGRRIGIDNPYEAPKAVLLDVVAAANRCRAVWSKSFGFSTVMGFPDAVAAVEMLFTSLLVQATAAVTQAGSRRDAYGRSRTRTFRQSFLTAYAHRIGERLDAAAREAVQDAAVTTGRDLLPVLAARDHRVEHAVGEMFPALIQTAIGPSSYDAAGWASGTAAADAAHLHGHAQVTARAAT